MGILLEADDATVFKATHNLVLRQEPLAKNRLAMDKHFTFIKLGYPWSRLEKQQDQNRWKQSFPQGVTSLQLAAVPNKVWDLVNKATEVLNVDPPQPRPTAITDDESAERAVEMAETFLTQDGEESGTNDSELDWWLDEVSLTRASSFVHLWCDPEGGGSIPAQIKAHPQATDPQNPLVAVDPTTGIPIPTVDYVLRYVTQDGGPDGAPAQFTDDPSQAARQWLPKICADRWQRQHVRTYPEDKDVSQCTELIGIGYLTLGEAKRRWPTVQQMADEHVSELTDWTPPRYLELLPEPLRARWKVQTGGTGETEQETDDQRYMFYYVHYIKQSSSYPKGAAIYCSGAFGGVTLDKNVLGFDVPTVDGKGTEPKSQDIPVVQVRLIQDTDSGDPFGAHFLARFAGSNDASSTVITSYLEAMDLILHPVRFSPSTSSATGEVIEEARASGDSVDILGPDDKPTWETPPQMPSDVLNVYNTITEAMNSMSGLTKPAQGADSQQEVSGIARNIAVKQALVSLSRMQQAKIAAKKRYWRIKCQLAQKDFTAPQQMRYTGADGGYKQEWWVGTDFSKVADQISLQPGTGTMMGEQEKVEYTARMRQFGVLSDDEFKDAARPTMAGTIGMADDPQEQHIERQVDSCLKGPPDGWLQQAQQYDLAKSQVDQQNAANMQAFQATVQQYQVGEQQKQAAAQNSAPPGKDGAPTPVATAPSAPPPQPPQQVPPPPPIWGPFQAIATDDEPIVAQLRLRRLRKLLVTTRFRALPPRWRQEAEQEYLRMRQAVAIAGQAAAQAGNAQKLSSDLEKIRLTAAVNPKAPAPGASQVEAQTLERDQSFLPQSMGASPGAPNPTAQPVSQPGAM